LGADEPLELQLEPSSDRYAADDDRWLDQVSGLYTSLREDVGGLRRESTVTEGHKCAIETVILALGTSGALTATIEALRVWLGRDRSRRMKITWKGPAGPQSVEIDADAIDVGTMQAALGVAAQNLPST
jgi:Effector Associated Constant Component 1